MKKSTWSAVALAAWIATSLSLFGCEKNELDYTVGAGSNWVELNGDAQGQIVVE